MGQTYAEMGRFLTAAGKPTNDENAAAKQNGKPVENPARNIWVTETALTTALNTAYFSEGVATYAIVMGVAMLLSGIGFLILTLRVLREPAGETEAAKAAAPRKQAAVTA
jgi:preprotein translocase subunit Sss1